MRAALGCALALALLSARASETMSPLDARALPLGRPFATPAGLGLSWLGAGVRVAHSGRRLTATFLAPGASFKVTFSLVVSGAAHWEGVAWVPASAANESVTVAAAPGQVDVVLNMPPQYFESAVANATLVSLTTDGAFSAPAPPQHVIHTLGDSITAATNIHGGTAKCADEGLEADYSASWAGLLGLFFDASVSNIAVGGKCLLESCGGSQMPDYYRKARMIDSGATFAFRDAPPAAFISYLGTNDQRVNEWTNFTAAYLKLFKNVTVDFCANVAVVRRRPYADSPRQPHPRPPPPRVRRPGRQHNFLSRARPDGAALARGRDRRGRRAGPCARLPR